MYSTAVFKVSELRGGDEIGIDSRVRGRDDGIEALAASIEANGLLQPLGVWRDPKTSYVYVAFGNRRRAALLLLEERTNHIQAAPCIVIECPREELLALSAIENRDRAPLGILDQYEAFAAMALMGMSDDRIAARFNFDAKAVRRVKRVGSLAPEIREAWAAGDLREGAAIAFATSADHAEQLRVFHGQPLAYHHEGGVRRALMGEGADRQGHLAFVGRDAYLAAGGALEEDLFGDVELVMNPGILTELLNAKVEEAAAAYIAKGWKWAALDSTLPYEWTYTWQTVKAAEKDRAGVVLAIGGDGKLTAKTGYVKPGDRPKLPTSRAGSGVARESTGETSAVLGALREAQTKGMAAAIAADPTAAKIALCATLLYATRRMSHGAGGSPLGLKVAGAGHDEGDEGIDIAEAVAKTRALSPAELDRMLAKLVGLTIDARTAAREGTYSAGVTDKGVAAVAGLLDANNLAWDIAAHFDTAAYFAGAKKDSALAAIVEMGGDAEAAKKLKKDALAKAATEAVHGKVWLPPAIRPHGFLKPPSEAKRKASANG